MKYSGVLRKVFCCNYCSFRKFFLQLTIEKSYWKFNIESHFTLINGQATSNIVQLTFYKLEYSISRALGNSNYRQRYDSDGFIIQKDLSFFIHPQIFSAMAKSVAQTNSDHPEEMISKLKLDGYVLFLWHKKVFRVSVFPQNFLPANILNYSARFSEKERVVLVTLFSTTFSSYV